MQLQSRESRRTRFFRWMINWYPMYFGTGGKVLFISGDWTEVRIQLRLNFWTRNYVGTMFGGSFFSASDPFYMLMFLHGLGKDFIVWDKAATIKFLKPARGTCTFTYRVPREEFEQVKNRTLAEGRINLEKKINWVDENGDVVCQISRTLYVATKAYHKKKRQERQLAS